MFSTDANKAGWLLCKKSYKLIDSWIGIVHNLPYP